jgi:hypothetical protein
MDGLRANLWVTNDNTAHLFRFYSDGRRERVHLMTTQATMKVNISSFKTKQNGEFQFLLKQRGSLKNYRVLKDNTRVTRSLLVYPEFSLFFMLTEIARWKNGEFDLMSEVRKKSCVFYHLAFEPALVLEVARMCVPGLRLVE